MEIKNCLLTDLAEIQSLYEAARSLQIQREMVVWPVFENTFIKNEITENRQWKILQHNLIACNWAVTFEDKEIWGEKDRNDSIYIHRICTHPTLRGNRYIEKIVEWSKEYARQLGKRFVRLDTLGNNTKLIAHYASAGFNFLGIVKLTDTADLPAHYQKEPNCCRFEIDLQSFASR
ncbi:GNAT family N-acetyltransferase [Pedobacter panaciterrae]|uniref:GNAT family N-acetyltransferase n=1 Tax=Pedobacter panaciterrae TaxID=363849 RepID=UPI00155D9C1F|nr:GNAT family N-acetyltransferase [Pedobacter panaciterrae]NQX54489.1 GNAT family N-acetyltransferase [Pedobacter panaciterrae]